MIKVEFKLNGDFVLLTSLLKAAGIAATGGHAGILIIDGEVIVNGEPESRKRRKCRIGDTIQVNDHMVIIV